MWLADPRNDGSTHGHLRGFGRVGRPEGSGAGRAGRVGSREAGTAGRAGGREPGGREAGWVRSAEKELP